MKTIFNYIKEYFLQTDKRKLAAISLFTAVLVFINYFFGLDDAIRKNNLFAIKLLCWYAVFLVAFLIPYCISYLFSPAHFFKQPVFCLFVLTAPLLFALKLSLNFDFPFSEDRSWNIYWNYVIYWPIHLLVTSISLFILWKGFDSSQPFYTYPKKQIQLKPYLLMLLIMIPFIAIASTQPDFLEMYPKLKTVTRLFNENELSGGHKLLYELSYGSDFVGIELFFRGFLILGFIKWAGKDAILPMACFYCAIHFGKPLAECISSYFGGILLGIIVYNTRSIYGGLLVHLGIAWLMELGGYFGSLI